MEPRTRIMRDGAIAGLLGALTIAVWFLIIDSIRGMPLETPRMLAAVLFHGGQLQLTSGWLVAEYTAFHFAAFVAFGLVSALLLEAAERERSLVIVLILLLLGLECTFIGLVLYEGPVLQPELSWWSVLVGNLLATVMMVTYFASAHPRLLGELMGPWMEVVVEGLIAGVIGGATVALWFLLCDLEAGVPLRTPALLAGTLLAGITDPAAIRISAPLIFGYTVVHFAAFGALGIAAAWLIAAARRQPAAMLGLLMLFACFEVFAIGFAAVISHLLLDQLGWPMIVGANALASVAMLAFFYMRHRDLVPQKRLVTQE